MLCCLFHRSLQCQCFEKKLCTFLATFHTMRLHLNMELSCTNSQINSALFINISLFWLAVNTSRPVGAVTWSDWLIQSAMLDEFMANRVLLLEYLSILRALRMVFYINEVHPSYHNKANGGQLNLISGPLVAATVSWSGLTVPARPSDSCQHVSWPAETADHRPVR